ncbi:HpsJ family protein [Cronbergia sp. UHCC 0137]|uniref:hormogonium polysaccharide biosynthesis protein HpsJ n=1 Tax=Cronbergia sp. UHCC 0137 TaxID=3110239 RepID=UPI002B1E90EC|nr:HpsJ family protein [Cronbergia sp. UHCC 0137]MEA5617086.1 HpsJ family protein [Cronbergia sp. UHCC 0137]
MVNRAPSLNLSLSLKLVGIVCILSFLLDFAFLLFPVQATDKLWQINLARNLVERGIVPLVGLGILLAAYWLDSMDQKDQPEVVDLKLPAFILSSILGLIFLLIVPLHLNTVNQLKVETTERINTEANQLEAQVNNQLEQVQNQLGNNQIKEAVERQRLALKDQLTTQLNEVVKSEIRYNQALQNNQIPPEQKDLIKAYKLNPKALDEFIARQTDPEQLAKQRITQVRTQKEQRLQQTQQDAWKEVRIGISSFLLSIAYIIIGWTGLRGMNVLQNSSKRRATIR